VLSFLFELDRKGFLMKHIRNSRAENRALLRISPRTLISMSIIPFTELYVSSLLACRCLESPIDSRCPLSTCSPPKVVKFNLSIMIHSLNPSYFIPLFDCLERPTAGALVVHSQSKIHFPKTYSPILSGYFELYGSRVLQRMSTL